MGDVFLKQNIKQQGFGTIELPQQPTPILPTISNLFLRYDASQITGINDGGQIAQWNDLSGSNRHLTQGTANRRPILQTNSLNGLPTVKFDGIDDHLQTANFGTQAQPNTIFIVLKLNGKNSYVFDNITCSPQYAQTLPDQMNLGFFGGAGLYSNFRLKAQWNYCTFITNGGSSSLRLNGVTMLTGNNGGNGPVGIRLGDSCVGNGAETSNINVAEFIFYNRLLNNTEILLVERYLQKKWGL
jgi:hypothetical protein